MPRPGDGYGIVAQIVVAINAESGLGSCPHARLLVGVIAVRGDQPASPRHQIHVGKPELSPTTEWMRWV